MAQDDLVEIGETFSGLNLVWDFSKPFFDRGGQTILELCDRIVRDFQPERIILFGAYTYGNATPDSEMNFNHPHA